MNELSPLAEAAILSRQWAKLHCQLETHSETCCDWYHGAWPTLRLIGSVSGAKADESFFQDAYTNHARSGDHILITGAADYAILEQVIKAYQQSGAEPVVTVLDLCDTTLELNRWYAEKQGLKITCQRGNILDYSQSTSFDLITTHSILSFIPEASRPALFKNWRKLLKTGGHLITSQAVRPAYTGPALRQFDADEVEIFVEKAIANAAWANSDLQLSTTALRALARKFAIHKTAFVVDSIERLQQGLLQAGFSILSLEEVNRSSIGHQSASPDASSSMVNARVIACAV